MVRFIFFVLILFSPFAGKGQKIDYPLNNRVTINYYDRIVHAHFTRDEAKVQVDDDKFYYWFAANDIKKTRGGYDGRILHGLYTEYYMNKNLKQKGKFHLGLQKGEWKYWYPHGELEEKAVYKKGFKRGYTYYHSNGVLKEKGHLLKDKPDGKKQTYDSTGRLLRTEQYKKGVLIPAKAPKQKKHRLKKLFNKKSKTKDSTTVTPSDSKREKKKVAKSPEVKPEENKKETKKQNNKENTGKKKKKDSEVIKIRKSKKIVSGNPEGSSI